MAKKKVSPEQQVHQYFLTAELAKAEVVFELAQSTLKTRQTAAGGTAGAAPSAPKKTATKRAAKSAAKSAGNAQESTAEEGFTAAEPENTDEE